MFSLSSFFNMNNFSYNSKDWFHLAQDRVQWWVFVNMVMNFLFL
jgi:hypothetical protein